MCSKIFSGLFGQTKTPTVETASPTPTVVDNGDDNTQTDQAAATAKKKRGFASTRSAVNTLLGGKNTLG
jgi:hypothetical protein